MTASLLASLLVLTVVASDQMEMTVWLGGDGVRARRVFRRARFIPYAAIESVESNGVDVTLLLRDGSTFAMSKGVAGWRRRFFPSDDALEVSGFAAHVSEQMAALRGREGGTSLSLARGGRTTRDWMRDLRAANEEQASFRTPAMPNGELWRLVEDSAVSQSVRAAAAVALREGLNDAGRARLRAVADACAAPRLRVALDTAASAADEGALLAVLEPLEDESPMGVVARGA